MTTAYDLTRRFLEVMNDIDTLLDRRAKESDHRRIKVFNQEIDRKECEMFEIKHKLQNIEI